jgi:acetolactate decarboxylase
MRHGLRIAAISALFVAFVGIAAPAQAADRDPLVNQIGTFEYLTQPDFTGLAPLSDALAGATLGIGTFDGLDGELIVVGGVPYRVGMDGRPTVVDTSRSTPFAQAVNFRPDAAGPVAPGTACADLGPVIQRLAGTDDGIIAVRVRGTFTDLVARSVPSQTAPYPSLATVIAQQAVFPLAGRRAVLVGFLQASDMKGIGQPGLHLHGLTADRSAGGHVLSCVVGSDVQVSVQRTSGVIVHDER